MLQRSSGLPEKIYTLIEQLNSMIVELHTENQVLTRKLHEAKIVAYNALEEKELLINLKKETETNG